MKCPHLLSHEMTGHVEKSGLSVFVAHHLSVGSTMHELSCVIVPRPSTPWCDLMYKQRSTDRDRLAVTSAFRLDTVVA